MKTTSTIPSGERKRPDGTAGTESPRHEGTKGKATERRRHEATEGRRDEGTKGSEPGAEATGCAGAALAAYRARQKSVAEILDGTFGPLAETDQSLWDRRAYLMLVGMVYERMAIGEDQLPTDELVALAKILAENRRAENQKGDTPASPGPAPDPTQTLESAVRDLYGLTLSPSSPAA